MTWVDELGTAVARSTSVDAGVRDLVGEFLAANRAVLESIGPTAGAAFFRTLAEHDTRAAWQALAEELNQEQLLAMLQSTRAEMQDAAAEQADRRAASQRAVAGFADIALTLLVRALVAAL